MMKTKPLAIVALFFLVISLFSVYFFYDDEKGYSVFVVVVTVIHFVIGLTLLMGLKIGRVLLGLYIKPLSLGVPGIYLAKYIEKLLKEENGRG